MSVTAITITVDNENLTGTVKDLDRNVTVPLKRNEPAKIKAKRILITLNTNEGFVFDSVDSWSNAGDYLEFSISTDKKIATLEIDVNFSSLDIIVNTVASQPEPPENSDGVTGFNHLYLVDKTILKSISKERFGVSNGENVVDLGQYIINVLELPFEIDNSIKGLKTPIKLGKHLLETEAIELIDDEININLGKIYVPNKYNNVYDYVNTDIYLHLPFSEKLKLDVEYVINETIGINYIIDLYSGETTINITSSKIGGNIIHSQKIKIGRNIPFIRKSGDVTGDIIQNNGLNNKIYKPFIEVIRNKPYEMDNPFNDDILVKTNLIHEKGYVIVENIILNTIASLEEKERILTVLKRGVYIK